MKNMLRRPLKLLFRLASISLLVVLIWACWLRPISSRMGPQPTPLSDGWMIGTPADAAIDVTRLDAIAQSLFAPALDVHGLLIERHGKLVVEYYQGGLDKSVYSLLPTRHGFGPNERHDIRSIGKSVNSLLYGIALDRALVPGVNTPLLSAFPEVKSHVAPDKQAIRIEDLLNMANGLQWQEGNPGLNDEIRLFWKRDIPTYVLDRPLQSPPNTRFNYNGGGTALLSELIRRGTQQSLESFADTALFQPLQFQNWEWVHDIHGRAMAFNGLRLRPRDLLKIGHLVLNHGVWQGKQIVPAAWIAQSMTPHFTTDVRDYRYGYQWWHGMANWQGKRIAWHAGFGNGGQRLYIVPDLDLTIVTTAGAYDQLPTAIRVNDLVQEIITAVGS